jgi:hypothetical protein
MYLIDWEKVITASSSDLSERMPEMNYHCEKEDSFTRYSNLYMYNCEEYDYTLLKHLSWLSHIILYKYDMIIYNTIRRNTIKYETVGTTYLIHAVP